MDRKGIKDARYENSKQFQRNYNYSTQVVTSNLRMKLQYYDATDEKEEWAGCTRLSPTVTFPDGKPINDTNNDDTNPRKNPQRPQQEPNNRTPCCTEWPTHTDNETRNARNGRLVYQETPPYRDIGAYEHVGSYTGK